MCVCVDWEVGLYMVRSPLDPDGSILAAGGIIPYPALPCLSKGALSTSHTTKLQWQPKNIQWDAIKRCKSLLLHFDVEAKSKTLMMMRGMWMISSERCLVQMYCRTCIIWHSTLHCGCMILSLCIFVKCGMWHGKTNLVVRVWDRHCWEGLL